MKTALESLDALEALARRVAEGKTDIVALRHEAMFLVAELPEPVSADTLKARQIIGDEYGSTRMHDGSLPLGGGPARVEAIKAGKGDEYWEMRVVKAALRRAREEGMK